MVAQDTEGTWISIPGGRNLLSKELAFVLSFTVPAMEQDLYALQQPSIGTIRPFIFRITTFLSCNSNFTNDTSHSELLLYVLLFLACGYLVWKLFAEIICWGLF